MQCNYNWFIQIINFHGLFCNPLRCRKLVHAEYWCPYGTIAQINTICHLCCTCTTLRMLTKLNKIDKNLVTWMSLILFFFFLLAKYSQRASTRNAYFIHKIIWVCEKIAQIHIIHIANLLWNHCCAMVRVYSAMVRSAARFSSNRLVHNKLTGVVQYYLIFMKEFDKPLFHNMNFTSGSYVYSALLSDINWKLISSICLTLIMPKSQICTT